MLLTSITIPLRLNESSEFVHRLSANWVRSNLPGEVFLADPAPREDSGFADALGVDDEHYVREGWNDFATGLATRFMVEHKRQLQAAADASSAANSAARVDLTAVLDQLAAAGIVTLGHARHQWLHQEPGYEPLAGAISNDLISQLLAALASVVAHTGGVARLGPDGVIEVRDGSRILGRLALASGRGVLNDDALRARTTRSLCLSATVDPVPSVIVTGATNRPARAVSPPVDITGSVPQDATATSASSDLVTAGVEPTFLTLDEVCADPGRLVSRWGTL